ncbi:MAG: NAD(P)-dependent alcohol dehydrogenase [Pseudomonadales bacterium]|nr:NAD(P)-dependent alcohol dehydrogenase [Pseudomonadales bacterium]
MKAVRWTAYGPPEVLQLTDIPVPEVEQDDILVRIEAANIFTGDCEMRQFKVHPSLWLPIRLFMGIFKPRIPILGQEFSGTVIEIGSDVDEFTVGDEVFGSTGMKFGSYAECLALPAKYPIIHKPTSISHTDASTISVGGLHALHFLRLANLKANEHILMVGACGCIGTYAIQLAKLWGATVTAIDSADKLEVLEQCGADRVIDYRELDFTNEDVCYDVIFDIVGSSNYSASLRCLRDRGRYILANVGLGPSLRAKMTNRLTDFQVITKLAGVSREELNEFAELVAAGSIRAIIDKTYPLKKTVEAHQYIEDGNKKGHVVLLPSAQ